MAQKDTQLFVSLRIDGCLKHRNKDIFQHLPKVWEKILRPEHITVDGDRD